MKKPVLNAFVFASSLVVTLQLLLPGQTVKALEPFALPEFTEQQQANWINSPPLRTGSLRGNVVLIDFWTYGCWNCYRSFPWLNAMEKRLANEDFQIIGIHTPEFEHEKVLANVQEKVREFELQHPIMIDNDFTYWRALNNRFWPAFYLIDKRGRVRQVFVGETHEGDTRALRIERTIRELLNEPT